MTRMIDVLSPKIFQLPQQVCASGRTTAPAHRTNDTSQHRRGRPPSAVSPIPLKWVTLQLYSASSGYSVGALRQKIRRGHFAEGLHFRKAPDGRVLINVEACQNWGGAK